MKINSVKFNNSLVDGPGIRTVLFMQGCDLHCEGCHNKISWDITKGKEISVVELANELIKNTINKKITISGGEPLMQLDELRELINILHKNGFDIALYTGHSKDDVPQDIINNIKYLKTGPFIMKAKTSIKPFVGSTNQTFEEVK